jgi:GDP-L-fucose synthase
VTGHFDLVGRKVWVAGHRGMVGSALVRRLAGERCDILTVERTVMDARRRDEVEAWLAAHRPDAVFVAAARVGGILANDTRPAEFLYDNLMIAANIIDAAHRIGVAKLLFLGSSCIYPRLAPQPIGEEALLTGPLEPTNQWYAIAKIAGIKLCQSYRRQYGRDFIACMPSNLYGPGDNFDLATGHVLAALIRKAHDAKRAGHPRLEIWGSGTPRREFLHVDDLADACVHLMREYSGETPINVGSGQEVTIRELAELVCRIVGFDGELIFDRSRPDGAPRKLLNLDRLTKLGWSARIPLEHGVRETYAWFLRHRDRLGR